MLELNSDPIRQGGIELFAKRFRSGELSSESVTQIYLDRINRLNPKLEAFEHISFEDALRTARAMDLLIRAGTDLGPLMGVPIAIKDVFYINKMPAPKAGSDLELSGILGVNEGEFIQALRKAGCVLLGTTKSVEFCLGITGNSKTRGTPWNPTDLENRRVPGGSSSGSGVATAAGLCAFSIGSDSGGSVRVPAAFNGIFGLKTTFGLWPTDGAFPLDPRVDSIGLLTKSAADAMIAFKAISSIIFGYKYDPKSSGVRLDRLNIGIPSNHFFNDLNSEISSSFTEVNNYLASKGCKFENIYVPEAAERAEYFPVSMPASLISILGKERFLENKHLIDPIIAKRIESGLESKAYDFLSLENRRMKSIYSVTQKFAGFDAWATPTTADFAPLLSDLDDSEKALKLALGMTQNTQPANYLGLCAISLSLPVDGLPIGYQLMGSPNSDFRLLEIAVEFERSIKTYKKDN
ncbi:amidase [Polaromonas sp. CG_23.6]|uniref:amidase n=1 Tax=Polaromonas sp. CG_23.6 TaxID=2760709 RepID=UPI002477007C|nr:amidase [Polaromonas sp. CG_23.6]MDH6186854.1 aspartyl-tRNA(Asn)/glutamyl-tRNA(Gln) amidotransferase subunit A [Polaromonas sp. CG_23.6]